MQDRRGVGALYRCGHKIPYRLHVNEGRYGSLANEHNNAKCNGSTMNCEARVTKIVQTHIWPFPRWEFDTDNGRAYTAIGYTDTATYERLTQLAYWFDWSGVAEAIEIAKKLGPSGVGK